MTSTTRSSVGRGKSSQVLEYEAILSKPGSSAEEKFRILDARDKLFRLSMDKSTDIDKVTSTKGVCPDMCPEKERLMRECKHQVSVIFYIVFFIKIKMFSVF